MKAERPSTWLPFCAQVKGMSLYVDIYMHVKGISFYVHVKGMSSLFMHICMCM